MTIDGDGAQGTRFYFVTHPGVVVSKDVPVPRWPLSERGRERMRKGLRQAWIRDITAIYCSTEQKAIDGAAILGQYLRLPYTEIAELGENDRSATGFLPPHEFECVADAFFARPAASVRGWERALDAQTRVVGAVDGIARAHAGARAIAIISHGAVGTLLYCHLAGEPIHRRWDQPPNRGGNFFSFTWNPRHVFAWWRAIDETVP